LKGHSHLAATDQSWHVRGRSEGRKGGECQKKKKGDHAGKRESILRNHEKNSVIGAVEKIHQEGEQKEEKEGGYSDDLLRGISCFARLEMFTPRKSTGHQV